MKDEIKDRNEELESKKYKDEKIEKEGQVTLDENGSNHKIHLITIVGEIEGHENAGNQSKVTKYELLLPQLASIAICGAQRPLMRFRAAALRGKTAAPFNEAYRLLIITV